MDEQYVFKKIKQRYKKSNKYMLCVSYEDVGILIHMIDILDKQLKEENNVKLTIEIEELNKSDASKEQSSMNYYNLYKELVDKIKSKIEELDIEIQCCEYADDDLEEYKQDVEKEKARLLRDKAILQSLLKEED